MRPAKHILRMSFQKTSLNENVETTTKKAALRTLKTQRQKQTLPLEMGQEIQTRLSLQMGGRGGEDTSDARPVPPAAERHRLDHETALRLSARRKRRTLAPPNAGEDGQGRVAQTLPRGGWSSAAPPDSSLAASCKTK